MKKFCVTCKKWFYCKSTLNRHVKNIHGNQQNVRRLKRQQDTDEVRNLLVKSRNFLKNLCDTVEKTNELAGRPESNIEEEISPVRSQNVYQNKTPSSGDRDTTQSFLRVSSTLHSNPAKQIDVITGVVRVILSSNSFVRKNGTTGTVQSFIVVDTLAKRMKSDVWRYKFVAWDEQAKNLSVEQGRTYRFEHMIRQLRKGKFSYPGQDDYEVHLTPKSTIVDVTC